MIIKPILSSKELEKIPDLYSCEDIADPICQARIMLVGSNWCWYVMEISKIDNDTCFGYVVGFETELGYFTLSELAKLQEKYVVMKDEAFTPMKLSEIKGLRGRKKVVGEG